MGLIRCYGRMVQKLKAQESMLMAERLGVGTGSIKASDQKAIRRRWNTEAAVRTRSKRVPTVQELGSIGVKFTKVPAKKT